MFGKVKIKDKNSQKNSEAAIYFVFEDQKAIDSTVKLFDQKTRDRLSYKAKLLEFKGKENQVLWAEGAGNYAMVYIVGVGQKADFSFADLKNSLANAVRQSLSARIKTLDAFYTLGKQDYFEVGKSIALGFYLGNYQFLKYKSKKETEKMEPVEELNILMDLQKPDLQRLEEGIEYGAAVARGTYLTKDLVNEPASHLSPKEMVFEALRIQKESKGRVKVEVINRAQAQKLGMGSYLGVAQGSDREPQFIVLKTSKNKGKKLALVGKTIIFDSGGLSLKPAEHMEDMKIDMAGGATVLGVFDILASLNDKQFKELVGDKQVLGVLPACENMPSGKALRPGDVLQAMNGKTIEVLNTDAEGRLTLADGLVYAEKNLKADYIIDIATLTGACAVALGNDMAGLFSNDQKTQEDFDEVSKREGDELWPLPLYKDYLKKMKSDIADLKNISSGRYGGAITAAIFLNEFVDKAKWIHLDVAGPAYRNEEPKGVFGKGATGWGIATLVEFIKKI